MSFTDDDWKDLKRYIRKDREDEWLYEKVDKFHGLISRLEAAEKLIGYRQTKLGYDRLLQAWRKAKGE